MFGWRQRAYSRAPLRHPRGNGVQSHTASTVVVRAPSAEFGGAPHWPQRALSSQLVVRRCCPTGDGHLAVVWSRRIARHAETTTRRIWLVKPTVLRCSGPARVRTTWMLALRRSWVSNLCWSTSKSVAIAESPPRGMELYSRLPFDNAARGAASHVPWAHRWARGAVRHVVYGHTRSA